MVILMAGFFLFTGCSKEDLTPVSNGVVPAAQKMGYYTITNNENGLGGSLNTGLSIPTAMGKGKVYR
jgi:hypothetical protein